MMPWNILTLRNILRVKSNRLLWWYLDLPRKEFSNWFSCQLHEYDVLYVNRMHCTWQCVELQSFEIDGKGQRREKFLFDFTLVFVMARSYNDTHERLYFTQHLPDRWTERSNKLVAVISCFLLTINSMRLIAVIAVKELQIFLGLFSSCLRFDAVVLCTVCIIVP